MDQHSFLFQAMIFLAAAVLIVPIARKTGLGSVLGYLLAGVVIGPYVFNFTGESGQDIMHAAEFGVVMMLFLIGLELDPALLWKMRKRIVGLGGLQVMISIVLLGIIFYSFGFAWQTALALGAILALSSTAIVLQTFQEKGMMQHHSGQSGFAVLLFQDIAVIPLLAIMPLLAVYTPDTATEADHGGAGWMEELPVWGRTAITIGSVLLIVVAGKYLMNPLFKIVARTRVRELFTASALLVVVAIAVLMSLVGLSAALGTFVGGVVLANSAYRHELESDIEPFKGLLLGLFFMAVGASIDFGLIARNPGKIILLTLGLMLLKGLILGALGKLFKLNTDQNVIFSVGLSQAGEFGFVLIAFCLQTGTLNAEIASLTTVVIALSMVLTPLFWLLNEKVVLPRLGTLERLSEREADDIEEKNEVIIAGFGHFGNTIGRFLRANGVAATYLDIDSDRVELLRKMGFKVYYGDASRHDLLAAAGAHHAKILIVALDDQDKRMAIVETAKKHFPNLRLYLRARNRNDAYEFMNEGMLHVYRETIDTSLRLGSDVLGMLGRRKYMAHRAAQTFFKYDETALRELAAIKDTEEYIASAKTNIEELEAIIRKDFRDPRLDSDIAWNRDGE